MDQHMRQRPTVNPCTWRRVCAQPAAFSANLPPSTHNLPPSTPTRRLGMPSTSASFAPLWFFRALSPLQKGHVTAAAQRSQRKMLSESLQRITLRCAYF
jgi:hypothetical protein